MLDQMKYLNEIWKIANEMDILLLKHYHQNNTRSHLNSNSSSNITLLKMEHFHTVIDAWKIVMDAYKASYHFYNQNHEITFDLLIQNVFHTLSKRGVIKH